MNSESFLITYTWHILIYIFFQFDLMQYRPAQKKSFDRSSSRLLKVAMKKAQKYDQGTWY